MAFTASWADSALLFPGVQAEKGVFEQIVAKLAVLWQGRSEKTDDLNGGSPVAKEVFRGRLVGSSTGSDSC